MQHKLMNLHMVINHNMHTVMEKKNHKASKGKKKKEKSKQKAETQRFGGFKYLLSL